MKYRSRTGLLLLQENREEEKKDEYLDSEGLEKTFVEASVLLDMLSSTFFVVPIYGRESFVDGPM